MSIAFSLKLFLGKYKRGRKIRPLYLLIGGCFFSGLLLSVAPYSEQLQGEPAFGLQVFVRSVQKAIRVFGADEIYEAVETALSSETTAPGWMRLPYMALTMAVQFTAPILTSVFVLSLFKNAISYLRYYLNFFRDVYVFSALNERSTALAQDIMKNHPSAKVIFTDVASEDDEAVADLFETAKEIGAICFKKDIDSISFGFHSKNKDIKFFAIGEDELLNIDNAHRIIDKLKNRENTAVYIFSSSSAGELLLSGKEKGDVRVYRIDETRNLVYNILTESGKTLFETAKKKGNRKIISAVLVGQGAHGTEMLKALSWFCQMDGYRVIITAFDKDPLAEERFKRNCPELYSKKYNGVYTEGEAEYLIKVNAGVDASSEAFKKSLEKIKDATYVFVSLGNQTKNIEVAAECRTIFEAMGIKPIIHTVVSNEKAAAVLKNVYNCEGQSYDITPVGTLEKCYSEEVIIESALEKKAFDTHKKWLDKKPEKIDDFWKYEYSYRSSMSQAIHGEITKKLPKEKAAVVEHKRWNAYVRSEGFTYNKERNFLAKHHPSLVVYSKLSNEDKQKDKRITAQKEKH